MEECEESVFVRIVVMVINVNYFVTVVVFMLIIAHNSDYHVVHRSGVHVSWKIEVKMLVLLVNSYLCRTQYYS